MNQKSILLIAFFLISQFAISQEEHIDNQPSKTTLGINLGGNFSQLRGDTDLERYSAKAGFLVGINFELGLGKNTALKTNINYESRSYGLSVFIEDPADNSGEWYDMEWDWNYVTLPVMFKYSLGKKQQFFVNGGPFISFKTTTPTPFNKTDIGLAAGFGINLKLDNNSLQFELRNNLGLTDYRSNLNDQFDRPNFEMRSNSVSLIATWGFDL